MEAKKLNKNLILFGRVYEDMYVCLCVYVRMWVYLRSRQASAAYVEE